MFKHVKIGRRLAFSYAVIIIITVAISVIGIINFTSMANQAERSYETVTKPLSYLTNFSVPYGNVRSAMRDLYLSTSDETNQKQKEVLEKNWALMETQISQYQALLESHKDMMDPGEYASVQKISGALVGYKDALFNRLVPAGMANENEEANQIRTTELVGPGNIIRDEIDYLTQFKISEGGTVLEEIIRVKNTTITYSIILLVTALAVVIFLAIKITNSIVKPIGHMIQASDAMANGNLDVPATNHTQDEIGILSRNFAQVVSILQLLIQDMNKMSDEYRKGDIDAKIDSAHFEGSYRTVAEGVNSMVSGTIKELEMFSGCMSAFGEGDFSADMPKMPGKKVILNQITDNIRNNLKSVNQDIGALVHNAIEGKLSERVNAAAYKGDWNSIMNELNRLMEAIAAPIREASEVLQQVSVGVFDQKIAGNYQGDFLIIKNSVNGTITNVASYIDEISQVLGEMSRNNLDQEITREYVGAFSSIKSALNNITDTLNNVFEEIYSAADQVASGARQISESSMALATGVSEQSSAVDELNAIIMTVNENAKNNSQNAKEAETLSAASKDNATKGDQDMHNMLSSMDGIKESSSSISKIIKVIDDIAFQTNLLALNAAVEAARAGTHGKGFAVVAEEVRNLAGRSKTAAGETAGMIEESISRVNEGTTVAGATAQALRTIVDDATKIAGIITNISFSSEEQTVAIGQITEGLSQVATIVQDNSSTSEESAAAAQQLSSQAEVLRNLIKVYNLKRRRS